MPNSNISLCARIEGDFSENELRRALEKVCIVHPLAHAKVIFDDDRNAWFSTDGVPEPMLRVVPRKSDTQWVDELQYEQSIPFNVSTGPFVRFVLLYSSSVSDFIVFAQHTICDGMALAFLVRDILIHFANPCLKSRRYSPPLLTDYIQKSQKDIIAGFMLIPVARWINTQWNKRRWLFDEEDFLAIHRTFWQRHAYKIVLLQLEKDETERLVMNCREHAVTVGSAMSTAFIAAYRDICGDFKRNQKHVLMPYDLRNRVDTPAGDVFCILNTLFQFKFDYNPKKCFWENVQTFHRRTRKYLDARSIVGPLLAMEKGDQTLVEAVMGVAPHAKDVHEGSGSYVKLSAFVRDNRNISFKMFKLYTWLFSWKMITTNLGRLPFPEEYGNLKLERLFFAPPADHVPLILGGVGVSGRTTFTLNYMDNTGEGKESQTETLIKVRNRALEHLGFPEKISYSAL
jgi:hypothetical protein